MIHKWLKHNTFHSEDNRKLLYLKLLFGMLEIRPNLIIEKIKIQRKAKDMKIPLIGHIHTPKTGGTYTNYLRTSFPHVNFSHVVVRTDRSDKWCPIGLVPINPKKIAGYYIFSTVRNPLLFLISYYHHVLGNMGSDNIVHYDYENALKGFDNLVNVIITRDDKWPSKKFLFPNLFDQNGNIVVDWINRNETLDNDLKLLLEKYDVEHKPQERQRVSQKKEPKEYYSKDLLEMVLKTYDREMKLFGYKDFENIEPKVNLKDFKSSNIKYDFVSDKLEWASK